jgi:hypothetical protein
MTNNLNELRAVSFIPTSTFQSPTFQTTGMLMENLDRRMERIECMFSTPMGREFLRKVILELLMENPNVT